MTDKARETISNIVAGNLGDVYCCTRVWEAWSVGTMSQSDFHLAAEDDDVPLDMADAILAALPAIIADMVPDLVWDENSHVASPAPYQIHDDNGGGGAPDDPYHEYKKYGVFEPYMMGFLGEFKTLELAIAVANAHNRATILKALGMKTSDDFDVVQLSQKGA